jgi:hypothetical protein
MGQGLLRVYAREDVNTIVTDVTDRKPGGKFLEVF